MEERPIPKAGRSWRNAKPNFLVPTLRKFNFLAFRKNATETSSAKTREKVPHFKLKYRIPAHCLPAAEGDIQRVLRYSASS